MKQTGLKDKAGIMIKDQDWVSLDGNMTTDNSMGALPNGWTFEESDVYQVYYDKSVENWSLKLGLKPDSPYNVKLINHSVSLLYNESVKIVDGPYQK